MQNNVQRRNTGYDSIQGIENLQCELDNRSTNDERLSIMAFRFKDSPADLMKVIGHPNCSGRTIEFIMRITEPKLSNDDPDMELQSELRRLMVYALEKKKEKSEKGGDSGLFEIIRT